LYADISRLLPGCTTYMGASSSAALGPVTSPLLYNGCPGTSILYLGQLLLVHLGRVNVHAACPMTTLTCSNEAQCEAYQKCFLEYYYCATVRGELSDIPAKTAGPYIHVGQA
jgi:hypothetical protein